MLSHNTGNGRFIDTTMHTVCHLANPALSPRADMHDMMWFVAGTRPAAEQLWTTVADLVLGWGGVRH